MDCPRQVGGPTVRCAELAPVTYSNNKVINHNLLLHKTPDDGGGVQKECFMMWSLDQ